MDPKSQELVDFLYLRMREHRRVVERWEQRRRTAIVQLVCNVIHLLAIWHCFNQIRDMPVRNDMVGRSNLRRQVMSHLMENERICRDVLRMNPSAFATLCDKLCSTGLLKDFSQSTIEEQVAKFLHVLGQNWKYRAIGCYFHRSSETISRHFHNILRAIISLENQFLKQSYGIDVAPQILQSSRFEYVNKVEYVTESMNKVACVLQEGNAIMKDSNMIAERAVDVVEKGRPRFYNEEEIYSAVHELGLHRNMQLDAYLFLINNNTAARSFFGTPPTMRAEVLMKMMNLL